MQSHCMQYHCMQYHCMQSHRMQSHRMQSHCMQRAQDTNVARPRPPSTTTRTAAPLTISSTKIEITIS